MKYTDGAFNQILIFTLRSKEVEVSYLSIYIYISPSRVPSLSSPPFLSAPGSGPLYRVSTLEGQKMSDLLTDYAMALLHDLGTHICVYIDVYIQSYTYMCIYRCVCTIIFTCCV